MVPGEASSPVKIDHIWQDFIHHKVNSFIKWDLVRFFHDNPHTVDTAENISYYIGHDAKILEKELSGLVEAEVLAVQVMSDVKVYSLTTNVKIRRMITDFVSACHNRNFRVQAINQVIASMNANADRNI